MSANPVPSVYQSRLDRAAAAMREQGVDVLLLTPGADMLYLTGFEHGHAAERLLGFALRADGSGRWACPQMNVPQVSAAALAGHPVRGWSDAETYLPPLRDLVAGANAVAFDDDARSAFLLDLQAVAPQPRVTKASTIVRRLRARKDPAELAAQRAAAKTVDDTIAEAQSFVVPGRSEREVDVLLRAALRRRSPESSVAFTIIASGPNAALPHHETGDRKIEPGDVVILDFGTTLNGYSSDITVTCSAGEPRDPEARKVYRVVWEAQQAALAAVRPGVPCEAVDRAARGVIERAGYGEFFTHRTGHGIGLQIHEPPYMVGGNAEPLEVGNTFSIEPGIYLPGRFGVRLEIITACGERGAEPLNVGRPPELPAVG
ncbi:MAG TPA: Xaa-Pro peptidase family protein [Humisphaera sp.]